MSFGMERVVRSTAKIGNRYRQPTPNRGHFFSTEGRRAEAGALLTETLHRGEIARGDAASITGLGERTARALLGTLVDHRLLGSDSPKGPVSLCFPVSALDVLFPRLFPEA
jgi:hypothetical protein